MTDDLLGQPVPARPARRPGRRRTARKAALPKGPPTLREERRLLREGHTLVAGMDEVGRGALAGPVTVGIVVVDATCRTAPAGVRDSKLLTAAAREALVPRLRRWAPAYAVGHAEPEEVDAHGIIAALRLAARRAMATLPVLPSCVILDGSHDWFTPPAVPPTLFDLDLLGRVPAPDVVLASEPSVVTMVKADMRCAAVAAASVLAKVERDAIMVERHARFPQYCWDGNKGYSAPEHGEALRRLGPCEQHRRSWSLPGQEREPGAVDGDDVLDVDALDALEDLDELDVLDVDALGDDDLDGTGFEEVDLDAPAADRDLVVADEAR